MTFLSKEIIEYSLRGIWHRKTRTFLTILSIFLGIAVIFLFVSFGLGLYNYVNQFATQSSADKVTIMPAGNSAPGIDDTFTISENDLDQVRKVSGVYKVSGLYTKVAEIVQNKKRIYAFIIGYDVDVPLLQEMGNVKIYSGRELKKTDTGKVVLGYNYLLDNKIFPNGYELNQKIEIQGEEFRVVGFYESLGNPQDDSQIYMTEETIKELYGSSLKGYAMAIAQVDKNDIENIIENIKKSLRASRNVEKGKEDFFVQSWQDLIATYGLVLNGIIGFVILIALISVIVSAINTANTMITSVLERVKEIGVMKAVGARNAEIFNIFLFESAFLGFVAGIIGVILGWMASYSTGVALDNLGWGFLSPAYPPSLFIGLILFATLTGAVSGAIPARQASKIRPVDALRYE
ncbi:MAG: ABC transporter permease [Nanoarchaeota archaeon]